MANAKQQGAQHVQASLWNECYYFQLKKQKENPLWLIFVRVTGEVFDLCFEDVAWFYFPLNC